jgi:hypothetical protein
MKKVFLFSRRCFSEFCLNSEKYLNWNLMRNTTTKPFRILSLWIVSPQEAALGLQDMIPEASWSGIKECCLAQ